MIRFVVDKQIHGESNQLTLFYENALIDDENAFE